MAVDIDNIRQRSWDFALTVVTMVLLATIGLQSFLGTLYVWWAQRTIAEWMTTGYPGFVAAMNAVALPQVVLLVLVMGLCVPKRLFRRKMLLAVSLAMVAVGLAAGVIAHSVGRGLAVYLALAGLIQVGVIALTAAGARGPSYLTEGRLTKLGSGLLHLGFIVFVILVAAFQGSPLMIWVFLVSALLLTGGTALSFWAERLAWRKEIPAQEHTLDI